LDSAKLSTDIALNAAPDVQDFVPIDYKARLVREAAHAGVITDSDLHDFMAELDEYEDMYGVLLCCDQTYIIASAKIGMTFPPDN
jgi:hypothetical protein